MNLKKWNHIFNNIIILHHNILLFMMVKFKIILSMNQPKFLLYHPFHIQNYHTNYPKLTKKLKFSPLCNFNPKYHQTNLNL